jgi:chemotaxis protein methyltransferase CheR
MKLPDNMLSDNTLQSISQQIEKLLGLNFPKNRWDDLERGLISAAKELGLRENVEALNIWLKDNAFSPKELEILSNHLTVGETYFFRDKAILDVFQKNIIPGILAERFGKDQSINIWSAGCCTGEEPYTLAILLTETIPDLQNWRISILATDINRVFLHKAKEGIYSNWSFRDTPTQLRERYFVRSKSNWQIIPEIKKMVHFSHLNLAEDHYPSPETRTNKIDIIFCRNVLMYFSNELIQSVGKKFYNALNPGGWFITTAVELNDENFSLFTRIQIDKSIVYSRTEKKYHFTVKGHDKAIEKIQLVKKNVPTKPKPVKTPIRLSPVAETSTEKPSLNPINKAKELFNNKQYRPCADLCSHEITKTNNKTEWLMLLVKSFANLGLYDKALDWGAQLLKLDGLNSESYYILATIFFEKKMFTESEMMLKRALYIDQTNVLSHLLIGNVYLSLANHEAAKRHFDNVKKLLASVDENKILEGSEGLTAGGIKEMVRLISVKKT